jgi:hypothetical protein
MKAVAIRRGGGWVWRLIGPSNETIGESAAEYATLEAALRAACDHAHARALSPGPSTAASWKDTTGENSMVPRAEISAERA